MEYTLLNKKALKLWIVPNSCLDWREMSNTEQASAASCPADTPGADPPTSTPGDPPRYVDRRRSWLTEDVPDVDDDDSIDDAIMLPILPLELAVVCCMTNFLLPGVGL